LAASANVLCADHLKSLDAPANFGNAIAADLESFLIGAFEPKLPADAGEAVVAAAAGLAVAVRQREHVFAHTGAVEGGFAEARFFEWMLCHGSLSVVTIMLTAWEL
jgi:hypothetical protein